MTQHITKICGSISDDARQLAMSMLRNLLKRTNDMINEVANEISRVPVVVVKSNPSSVVGGRL
jgi:hypothetical protein